MRANSRSELQHHLTSCVLLCEPDVRSVRRVVFRWQQDMRSQDDEKRAQEIEQRRQEMVTFALSELFQP
jgi:hypothetical protein